MRLKEASGEGRTALLMPSSVLCQCPDSSLPGSVVIVVISPNSVWEAGLVARCMASGRDGPALRPCFAGFLFFFLPKQYSVITYTAGFQTHTHAHTHTHIHAHTHMYAHAQTIMDPH